MKFEFSRQILEKYSKINYTKIRPVRVELSHVERWTDGRADLTKLIVALRNLRTHPSRMSNAQYMCLDVIELMKVSGVSFLFQLFLFNVLAALIKNAEGILKNFIW